VEPLGRFVVSVGDRWTLRVALMPGKGYRVPVLDRFWAKVQKRTDGCWEWTGMRVKPGRNTPNGSGYGYLWLEGKMVRAHRLAYELFVAPIPAGLLIMHSCDRPWCVNPDHLSAGTSVDNARDCVAKGRHRNQWGTAGMCGLR
jgi:hypothetical protein